jgi:predicted nucleic acid-binding protein
MNCTIDASVLVAAARAEESQYAVSLAFLEQVQRREFSIFCPVLVLPECSAAIARPTGDETLAEELVGLIEAFPGLHLVPLSLHLAHRAARIAAVHRLRGADAIYVAVAEEFEALLVTWDLEMLERGALVVQTATPQGWIESQQGNRQA